jgi:hypothetical protein
MAKSMDFPDVSKKKKYSDTVKEIVNTEYIAVPGVQGERGDTGPALDHKELKDQREIRVILENKDPKGQRVSVESQVKGQKDTIVHLDNIQDGLIIKIKVITK